MFARHERQPCIHRPRAALLPSTYSRVYTHLAGHDQVVDTWLTDEVWPLLHLSQLPLNRRTRYPADIKAGVRKLTREISVFAMFCTSLL